jgi:hypothetical protein
MPSDDAGELDDADLPGLDADPGVPAESDPVAPPDEQIRGAPKASHDAVGPEWTNADLDEWFEADFGGHHAFDEFYFEGGGHRVSADSHPDLHFGAV